MGRRLHVEVVSAAGLAVKHSSMPYCTLEIDGQIKRVAAKNKDILNPVFNTVVEFEVPQNASMEAQVLTVTILCDPDDKKKRGEPIFLGKVNISGAHFANEGGQPLVFYSLKRRGILLTSQVNGEVGLKLWWSDDDGVAAPPTPVASSVAEPAEPAAPRASEPVVEVPPEPVSVAPEPLPEVAVAERAPAAVAEPAPLPATPPPEPKAASEPQSPASKPRSPPPEPAPASLQVTESRPQTPEVRPRTTEVRPGTPEPRPRTPEPAPVVIEPTPAPAEPVPVRAEPPAGPATPAAPEPSPAQPEPSPVQPEPAPAPAPAEPKPAPSEPNPAPAVDTTESHHHEGDGGPAFLWMMSSSGPGSNVVVCNSGSHGSRWQCYSSNPSNTRIISYRRNNFPRFF